MTEKEEKTEEKEDNKAEENKDSGSKKDTAGKDSSSGKKKSSFKKPDLKLDKLDFKDVKLDPESIKTMLKELWAGKVPLFKCFWIYYFATVVVLNILAAITGGPAAGLFEILGLAWAGFMVMPVVRSAENYKGDPTWATLAKVAAVLIAIFVAAGILNMLAS
jgi:hypothetical protein